MTITLNDIRLYAFHGALEQEAKTGGWFRVGIEAHTDMEKAKDTDALADTVNYADIAAAVREEMGQRSLLLEHVAGRIGQRLLRNFPTLTHVRVSVTKENPPIPGLECAGIGITIDFNRS